jgi:hypothetical protein
VPLLNSRGRTERPIANPIDRVMDQDPKGSSPGRLVDMDLRPPTVNLA